MVDLNKLGEPGTYEVSEGNRIDEVYGFVNA